MNKKFILLAALAGGVTLGAQAQQLPNANFNGKWVDCIPFIGSNETGIVQGTQPEGWVISNVNGYQGLGATIVGSQLTENENLAVALKNTPNPLMASQIVPAYMSLGTTWNTSKGMFPITNKDGGSFGGMKFTHRPDAIQFKYKRTAAEPSVPATVVAYMWKGEWQQADVPVSIALSGEPTKETMINRDRSILGIESAEGGAVTKSEDALCIAQIQEKLSEITEEWKEMTIPFNYADKNAVPTHINVIFAANDYFDASTVKKDNTLSIDDVAFVYYHALESLTYGDKVYTPNAEGVIDLSEVAFDANTPMQFHVKGVGATVEKGTLNADTQEMTLEVRGNDFAANPESKTTYTLRFKAEAPAPALELTSLTISGMPFEALEAGKTAYTLPYVYNPGIVFKGTTNEGYTVGESVFDNKAKTHTVNVVDPAKNDTTSYVFSFTDAVEDAATGNYEGSLSVVLTAQDDNSVPTALSNANIRITKNANGTINLAIDDFSFGGMVVGDIFVSNVPMKDGKIEKTRRTILMTDFDEAGNKLEYSLGWMMGALPVEVSADLNTTDKRTSASIDIITAENPMLAMMFKGIHVDFVPFTVSGEMKENGFGGRQYYENLKVKGAVTKENCKFLQINNHYVDAASNNEEHNLPMSYLDLSEATVAANVTMDDIMAGAPKANNTLVYLPAGSTIQAANAIVDSKATNFVVNDQVAFHAPKAFTATQVSYNRAFNTTNGYVSSFVLPFAMNTNDVDGKVYKFNAVNGDNVNFTEVTGQLEANVPYLIVANSANPFSTALANGVQIAATPEKMEVTASNAPGFAHIGSYNTTKVTSTAEATYYGYTGGKFVKANTGTLNPFRTLIKATGATATQLSLKLDGEVTGIIGVNTELGKVDVYNLEGKLVRSQVEAATALQGLEKGVYVINGKKVMK